MREIDAVLDFLDCRSPAAWIERAAGDIPGLLLDHALLELKAAEQAQKIIRRYGARLPALIAKMSRLAREELRHFEQVVAILDARGIAFEPVSASRYAAGLHAGIRADEPGRMIDTLLVGAIIEARSCERFYSLLPALESADAELARFYRSLLKSEARHFSDYLSLAERAADGGAGARLERLLQRDRALILGADTELRFFSGAPA